jgi:hypothetical protein
VFSKYNLSVVVRVEAVVAGGSGGYEEGCVHSKYNLSVMVRVEAVVAGGSGGYEEGCVHTCSANTAILENWFQILCGRGSGYGKYIYNGLSLTSLLLLLQISKHPRSL